VAPLTVVTPRLDPTNHRCEISYANNPFDAPISGERWGACGSFVRRAVFRLRPFYAVSEMARDPLEAAAKTPGSDERYGDNAVGAGLG
jgi:hypothetical protein